MSGPKDELLIDPATGRARRLDLIPADLSGVDVVVLCGGQSGEREVSLVSGTAILEAFEKVPVPSRPQSLKRVVIEADGNWLLGESSVSPLVALQSIASPSVLFFLGLHGGEGEDGTIQGLLGGLGLRYTGSGVGASALCMDKRAALGVLRAGGVAVCDGLVLGLHDGGPGGGQFAKRLESLRGESFFVKPNDGGSSVATFRVGEKAGLIPALEKARAAGVDRILIEPEVRGVEVSCGVLGPARKGAPLRTLPPIEIIPHEGRFFDYEEKYSEGGAVEICPPRSLDREQCLEVEAAAVTAFELLGCRGYARIDFIVPAGGGPPVCLEANTLPGFTPRSLFPQEAAAVGVDFGALCVEIARLALE